MQLLVQRRAASFADGGSRARARVRALPAMRSRQFRIKAPGNGADALGPRRFRVITV